MLSSTFLDEDGRPSFNILQNYGSSQAPVLYFVFDVMILSARSVMRETLETRREILEKNVLPKLANQFTMRPHWRRSGPCSWSPSKHRARGAGREAPG
jgi:ATP-dependent DNA ligase